MNLYQRMLVEREIAPTPMPGENPILMTMSREIAEGKRAMPVTPVPSTMRKSILSAMKAEACE